MTQNSNNEEISIKEQLKKLAVKSMYGYQTVLLIGLGRRLGIFDYLYEKAKSSVSGEKITSVSFTLEELSEKLSLDLKYLDGWVHMALECGLFEIDESHERCVKTAPHIYELLVDQDGMFYMGSMLGVFYLMAPFQDTIYENFKTGKTENILETPIEAYREGQRASGRITSINERLFAKYCKDDRKKLMKQGAAILEVGCGYGFTLEIWAKKYKKVNYVGIDIDPNGIAHAKELVKKNDWSDRIDVSEIPLEEYVKNTNTKFDMVILNEVLHEMPPDDSYRKGVFENIYTLLKDDGIFMVTESIIPDTFAPKKGFLLYEVAHKWLEVPFGSKFYDEKGFRELVDATPFKSVELIRERGNYFWAIRK